MSVVRAPPRHRQTPHRHEEARLVVFISGEMAEESFGGIGRFTRGEFVFRPAWFGHADCAGIYGAAYTHLPVSRAAARKWVACNGWRAGRGRVELGRLPEGDDVISVALAAPYVECSDRSPVRRAARLLAADAHKPVGQVAIELGMAPYALSRRFQAAFGVSPAAYRRQARLQTAMKMMIEDGQSLAWIACEAGFHDQSHFTTELRRETGLTPRAFIAAA
jgi:AraC-like DNA-binding protein